MIAFRWREFVKVLVLTECFVSAIPQDNSSPWSSVHLRGTTDGPPSAPWPEMGYVSSSSEGLSVSTPAATLDQGHVLIEGMSSMSLVEDGSIWIGQDDVKKSLKELGASLDDTWPTHGKKPSLYQSELEIDDDGDQAGNLTGDTPATGYMPQEPDLVPSVGPRYKCATQTHGCADVRIGYYDQILRWRRGSELSYVVCIESFPSPLSFLVEDAMKKAIGMWQGIAVNFKQVGRDDPATFAVKYDSRSVKKNFYARAFFPDTEPAELFVYEPSLTKADFMANILAHEIGHILGLRHEFAHEREQYNPSVLLGSEDAHSVMNYYKHPQEHQVSEQDLEGLKKLYAIDQAEYEGLSIIDIDPELHPFGKGNSASHATRESGRRCSF